jgi:CBS domain-containing protein
MQVSEVMHKGVVTVQIHDTLKRVASIMKREDIGSVPVYKDQKPVGFVTDRDIVITSIANGHSSDAPISEAMSKDIISIYEDESIERATFLMKEHQVSRLLVVDRGDRPVGMISLQELAENMDSQLAVQTLTEIKRS